LLLKEKLRHPFQKTQPLSGDITIVLDSSPQVIMGTFMLVSGSGLFQRGLLIVLFAVLGSIFMALCALSITVALVLQRDYSISMMNPENVLLDSGAIRYFPRACKCCII
ncbi:hypothetical protein ACJX0J_008257, partial [Zea mays]